MTEKKQTADLVEVNKSKINSWNECIAPRAPMLLSYLKADEFQKGILVWMSSIDRRLTNKLIAGCATREEDQFIRGQLLMLREIMELPETIQNFIDQGEMNKKAANSRGQAGY